VEKAEARSRLWGHDHDGAYRQLPVKDPEHAYLLLLTDQGPTLWQHNVLLFGAKGSVWAYNRFGDSLCALARCFLAVSALHYVDDYGGAEPLLENKWGSSASRGPDSAFSSFSGLNTQLGFHMKPSKAQPPALQHRIQGVHLRILHNRALVMPTPQRVTKVLDTVNHAIETNSLPPSTAAELGGKCSYLSTSTYGKVGRAASKPVYARQHSANLPSSQTRHHKYKLTHALHAALVTIQHLLRHSIPRSVQFQPTWQYPTIIYADAFFMMGDKRMKPSGDIPEVWDSAAAPMYRNGWGAVAYVPVQAAEQQNT